MDSITYRPIGSVERALRYLCGGACRAWSRLPEEAQSDLDAPPRDCAHLQARARWSSWGSRRSGGGRLGWEGWNLPLRTRDSGRAR